jgi:hypothetical protein
MTDHDADETLLPRWFQKLPSHIQLFIMGFVALHLLGIVGALVYYSNKDWKPTFSKKMK